MQRDKALGNEEVGIGEPSAGPLASVIYRGLVRKSLDENLYTMSGLEKSNTLQSLRGSQAKMCNKIRWQTPEKSNQAGLFSLVSLESVFWGMGVRRRI